MDKKSKVLVWLLVIAIIFSVGITFYQTIISENFEITDQAPN